MPSKNNLLIIGAGLAGLSAAYHLKKDFSLFEKEPKAGGVASSDRVDGFVFDKTAHLLHFQTKYVKDLLFTLSNDTALLKHRRSSWVFSKDTYTRYPFQINTYRLPPSIVKDCLVKMAQAHSALPRTKAPQNFKDWILDNFGEGVARHFMFPYNRKLWKTPLEDMSTDWVERFIPKASFDSAVKGAITDFSRNYGYNKNFYYPERGGIQVIPELLLARIRPRSYFNRELISVDLRARTATFKDGKSRRFNRMISCLPLPELCARIKSFPAPLKRNLKQLRHVSVVNLNLGIDRDMISDKHWIYFPESRYVFYRAGFSSNFSKELAPQGKSSLYAEVSYTKKRPLPCSRGMLKHRIIEDLRKAGILRRDDKVIAEKLYDVRYGYPVHDANRLEAVDGLKKFLTRQGIHSIGRYGSWRYMTMEDCILQGKETADLINTST
ncbi:MAG: FAD-dependent oxidoreductase [Candidatus Omnitrophica bacterium]|nr:FAD-dependent oxidoreductase [Candidatus Omnitrophota bacterium]